MCGRFSLTRGDRDEIENAFRVRLPSGTAWKPRYNIAPTQEVLVILEDERGRWAELLRWGLIPSWASDPKVGNKLINARAETLFERPAFREAARRRRCLIVADGFYEWQKRPDGRRVPFYIRRRDGRLFGMAGIWETWKGPEGPIQTCAVVTVEADDFLKPIHARMPAILSPQSYDAWLDPQNSRAADLVSLLRRPYPSEELECYPVSRRVNRAEYDGPECVRPLRNPSAL